MKTIATVFIKDNCTRLEADLQRAAAKHGFAPKVIAYEEGTLVMENIGAMCLADMYGASDKAIPRELWPKIREILDVLYFEERIEYVDITGYNFIEKDGKVFIIDFGHAYYRGKKEGNWFLKEFMMGEYGWNPDFE